MLSEAVVTDVNKAVRTSFVLSNKNVKVDSQRAELCEVLEAFIPK